MGLSECWKDHNQGETHHLVQRQPNLPRTDCKPLRHQLLEGKQVGLLAQLELLGPPGPPDANLHLGLLLGFNLEVRAQIFVSAVKWRMSVLQTL